MILLSKRPSFTGCLCFLFLFVMFPALNAQIWEKEEKAFQRVDQLRQKVRHRADSLSKGRFGAIDKLLTNRYMTGNYDPLYIRRPDEKWTVRSRLNVSGARINALAMDADTRMESEMRADYKATASITVSYLGLAAGIALNPMALVGKYKDYEFNLNSYNNRFGFDVIYQNAKRFEGWYKMGNDKKINADKGAMSEKSFNVNAYYAFNFRHFSYPAAFSQTYIQKRSAGSLLAGISCEWQEIKHRFDEEGDVYKLKANNFSIGAGYGYNWVPSGRWLIHFSSIPTFIVARYDRIKINDETHKMKNKFPELILTARGAVVYNFRRYFLGVSMVYNFSKIGDDDHLELRHKKWRSRAFIGLRI